MPAGPRAAAVLLGVILAWVEAGELTASARVVARLEGAATGLEALGGREGRSKSSARD
jgi:hypothetical protein